MADCVTAIEDVETRAWAFVVGRVLNDLSNPPFRMPPPDIARSAFSRTLDRPSDRIEPPTAPPDNAVAVLQYDPRYPEAFTPRGTTMPHAFDFPSHSTEIFDGEDERAVNSKRTFMTLLSGKSKRHPSGNQWLAEQPSRAWFSSKAPSCIRFFSWRMDWGWEETHLCRV